MAKLYRICDYQPMDGRVRDVPHKEKGRVVIFPGGLRAVTHGSQRDKRKQGQTQSRDVLKLPE